MTIATGLTLLLAAGALSAADKAALDVAVETVFAPYRKSAVDTGAAWDRPIYSAEIRALIARWHEVMPKDEPDALNDADWLCQCQDWDQHAFRAVPLGTRRLGDGLAEVRLRVDLGHGERRPVRLLMKREGGRWLIDDFYGDDFPKGLKQKIRDTIKEDESL